jgi:hypothetical protein
MSSACVRVSHTEVQHDRQPASGGAIAFPCGFPTRDDWHRGQSRRGGEKHAMRREDPRISAVFALT